MFASRTNWPLTPNRLSAAIAERRRQSRPILDLTESNPTRCGFEMEGRPILSALASHEALKYEPDPRGILPAREAVASYYAERGSPVPPDQIFLTAGTSEAYSYVFRLLANAGDNVLTPQPSYPLFDYLAGLNDLELASYSLRYAHGWHLDAGSLEARRTSRTRAIVVVHPNNPTGSFIRRAELDFLVDNCRRHHLALVADEVFADYALEPDEQRVPSHAGVSEALTFTLSGLSKISALPQMKLAWIVVNGPAEILRPALDRLEIIADTYLSVGAPMAAALPRLLELRRRIQPQILERVRGNLRRLDEMLGSNSPLTRLATEGGWCAIVRLPSVRSDEDWAIELLIEEGVLVHPGHFYDFSSEGYLVLSLLPPPEVFAEGVSRLAGRVEGRL
jgi:alanine-synthesizing transaminase